MVWIFVLVISSGASWNQGGSRAVCVCVWHGCMRAYWSSQVWMCMCTADRKQNRERQACLAGAARICHTNSNSIIIKTLVRGHPDLEPVSDPPPSINLLQKSPLLSGQLAAAQKGLKRGEKSICLLLYTPHSCFSAGRLSSQLSPQSHNWSFDQSQGIFKRRSDFRSLL